MACGSGVGTPTLPLLGFYSKILGFSTRPWVLGFFHGGLDFFWGFSKDLGFYWGFHISPKNTIFSSVFLSKSKCFLPNTIGVDSGGQPGDAPPIIRIRAKPLFCPPNNQTRIF